MGSVLKDMIEKEIVKPMLSKRMHTTIGTIISYDSINNTAVTEFANNSGGKSLAYDVPCCIQANGVHTVDPKSGDSVTISFNGGEITSPRITGYYSTSYSKKDIAPTTNCGPDIPDFFSYL